MSGLKTRTDNMLKYRLISEDKDNFIYEYNPEENNNKGIIRLNQHTGETNILKLSTDDKFKKYAFHLMRFLETSHRDNTLNKDGIVAWC